jgi:hypothetical protein
LADIIDCLFVWILYENYEKYEINFFEV